MAADMPTHPVRFPASVRFSAGIQAGLREVGGAEPGCIKFQDVPDGGFLGSLEVTVEESDPIKGER
jgi:hypothetical protein